MSPPAWGSRCSIPSPFQPRPQGNCGWWPRCLIRSAERSLELRVLLLGQGSLARDAQVPRKSQDGEKPNEQIADVDLPPAQAVTGRRGKSVMRIVPAFSEGQ